MSWQPFLSSTSLREPESICTSLQYPVNYVSDDNKDYQKCDFGSALYLYSETIEDAIILLQILCIRSTAESCGPKISNFNANGSQPICLSHEFKKDPKPSRRS